MNKDNSLAIRFGLIAGLLFTLLCFGCWAAGIKVFGNFLIWSTWIPVFFIIILVGAFQRRKQLGGFMSFKEGLVFAFLAYVIFEVFYAVSTFVLFRLIDPQLQDKVFIYVMDVTRNLMESIGASDSQVDDAIERARESNQEAYTIKQVILGFGLSLIWDFIKSLIIALISQRKKPEFGDVRSTNL
jgi:Protein of unknown function (DUF4199)